MNEQDVEILKASLKPAADLIVGVSQKVEQIANALSTICLCAVLATIVMFVKACG